MFLIAIYHFGPTEGKYSNFQDCQGHVSDMIGAPDLHLVISGHWPVISSVGFSVHPKTKTICNRRSLEIGHSRSFEVTAWQQWAHSLLAFAFAEIMESLIISKKLFAISTYEIEAQVMMAQVSDLTWAEEDLV